MARIKVKAKFKNPNRFGYYNDTVRNDGDEFFIKNKKDFSPYWMVKIDAKGEEETEVVIVKRGPALKEDILPPTVDVKPFAFFEEDDSGEGKAL